ncbi:MAG: PAS domain S-box protein [Anaerolineae bacterium]|nr:PAS domain S-box protein [Anaerolineae bacterium]
MTTDNIQLYRSIFEHSRDAIIITSPTGEVIACNRAAAAMFGYNNAEEMRGVKALQHYVSLKDRETFLAQLEERGSIDLDLTWLKRKDGTQFLSASSSVMMAPTEDSPACILNILRNVTEFVRIQEALQESERKYRATLDAMGDMIHVVDRDFRITLSNTAWKDLEQRLGMERHTTGRSLFEIQSFLPDTVRQEYERVLETRKTLITEECVNILGEEYTTETRKIPIVENGDVTEIVTVIRDITAQKQVEEALRESEEYLRLLLENSEDIIVIQDETGKYLYYNGPQKYRLAKDDVIGKTPFDFWEPAKAADMVATIKKVFKSGRGITKEVSVVWRGQPLWFHDSIQPVRDADGTIVAVGIISHNITERRQMEAQLQKYIQHLEQMVEDKLRQLELEHVKAIHASRLAALGALTSSVAHELKQPLSTILLDVENLNRVIDAADIVPKTPHAFDPSVLAKAGANLMQETERCLAIINHMRSFSRVSQGKAISVDLNQVVKDSFFLTQERLKQQNVVVDLDLAPDLPRIAADPLRLEQVILNLVSNAAFAMAEMERRVKTGEVDHPHYVPRLSIATFARSRTVVAHVKDNGCGIEETDQEHIFEPFFTTREAGLGTGLGLSTSFDIVTSYDGEITFESTRNQGTKFTLRFPILDAQPRQSTRRKLK